MSEINESIFRRWVDNVWIKGDEGTIDELLDNNSVSTYPNSLKNKQIYGKEGFKEFVRFIRSFFINIDITIEQITADDKKVVAICIFNADRRKLSENQKFEPKSVSASGLCQIVVENGKIIQTWSNIDLFGQKN